VGVAAQLSQLPKQHSAGDDTRDNAVPEEHPFGRLQTLKTDRLRQPRCDLAAGRETKK